MSMPVYAGAGDGGARSGAQTSHARHVGVSTPVPGLPPQPDAIDTDLRFICRSQHAGAREAPQPKPLQEQAGCSPAVRSASGLTHPVVTPPCEGFHGAAAEHAADGGQNGRAAVPAPPPLPVAAGRPLSPEPASAAGGRDGWLAGWLAVTCLSCEATTRPQVAHRAGGREMAT